MQPNALKAALRTALWTFIASFGLALTGWLSTVSSWATTSGASLPSINPLGKAAIAALVSAVSGIVGFIVNKAQENPKVPGQPAQFPVKSTDPTDPYA